MRHPTIELTRKDVLGAMGPTVWDFANDWLYKLCQQYPGHDDESHCIAKVWLIGRSYSAAIERKSAPAGSDKLYKDIAPRMRRSKLDELIAALPNGRNSYLTRFSRGVEVHADLMKIWSSAGANGKRSLASKYLHFHRPEVFPILDSFALGAIRKVSPDARRIGQLEVAACDETYKTFCTRYAWLLNHIEERFQLRPSLRQVDQLLLAIAGRKP